MKTTTRGILLTAILALSCAAAFGATPSSVWTGTVASISGDDLALVGIPVHFRLSGPVLEPMSGRTVRAGDLAAGSAVTVTAAEREVDGRLRATSVRVLTKNPFSLSGSVARISDDRRHIEVEGVSIGIDDRTAFSGRNVSGRSIRSAAELRVGMSVRVTLTAMSAGDLRATLLSAKETEPEPAEDLELKGTVDAVSDGEWKIGGRGFVIDENTVFVGDPESATSWRSVSTPTARAATSRTAFRRRTPATTSSSCGAWSKRSATPRGRSRARSCS
jgi:hypothetical protein